MIEVKEIASLLLLVQESGFRTYVRSRPEVFLVPYISEFNEIRSRLSDHNLNPKIHIYCSPGIVRLNLFAIL